MKQRCALKQFIAINDNLEVDARVFISNNQNGEESKTAERNRERERERERETDRETERQRDRERVCERDNVSLRVKDRVGHKMDSWQKNLVTDMCD